MKNNEKYGQFKSAIKFVTNVISWTAFAVLVLIAGMLIFYVVSVQLYASRGEKYEPPVSLYTIISPSMEPAINVLDVIVNTRVRSVDDLEEGDVITFISTSALTMGVTITHRIEEVIETEEGIKFKTKGDSNLTSDAALVSEEDILGKVEFRIPQLGKVQSLLASKMGWLFLIVIPALGIIIYDILKLFKLVGVKKEVTKLNEAVDNSEKEAVEKMRKVKLKEKLGDFEQTVDKSELRLSNSMDDIVIPDIINENKVGYEEEINTSESEIEINDDYIFELPKLKDED